MGNAEPRPEGVSGPVESRPNVQGQSKRVENTEPRPEREPGPESQSQKIKDSEPKAASQGQMIEAKVACPQNRKIQGQGAVDKKSRSGSQGQEFEAKEIKSTSQGQRIKANNFRHESQSKAKIGSGETETELGPRIDIEPPEPETKSQPGPPKPTIESGPRPTTESKLPVPEIKAE